MTETGGTDQIGFNLPLSGALSSASAFTRLAIEGEALGFDYIPLAQRSVPALALWSLGRLVPLRRWRWKEPRGPRALSA